MTQTPAGWYPEPDPSAAGATGRLRYWDGTRWTDHVHDPAAPPAAGPVAQHQQSSPTPGFPTHTGYYDPGYGYPPIGYAPETSRETTPDGAALAGWWMRGLALVLDAVLVLPLYAVVVVPLIAAQWDTVSQWSDDMQYAADNGLADPPIPWVFWAAFGLCVLTSLVYQFVFLWWKQATLGKLITGLRVRLRERPELPVGAIGLRMLGTFLIGLCSIAVLLDYLWPLWDGNRQALHDKMARTNVVRVR